VAREEDAAAQSPVRRVFTGLQWVGRHALWITVFTVPAVVLWWHVWNGHPSSTLTCACGDPAQEVWFMAWPAWALAHFTNPFFSHAVNSPHGANLLSNTSGTLVGTVLSPVTWAWGPVVATNVALTLSPGLSTWGCWLAIRRYVTWKPAALPAAFVFGYSSAVVTSLIFGHVSVTMLVIPPLLLAALYELVVVQQHTPLHDGLVLAAMAVLQFLISPEVLVMTTLLGGMALVIAVVCARRQWLTHGPYALKGLAVGIGTTLVLVTYPAWYGLNGPQSVSGVLFAIAPLAGVMADGFFSPGPYMSFANAYVRFGGYFGRIGPPPDYLGWGVGIGALASVVLARRRPIVWLLVVITLLTAWLALGSYVIDGPRWLEHLWLPWRSLSKLPVLQEILPDQLSPFIALFLAILLAIGLNAASLWFAGRGTWSTLRVHLASALTTVVVGVCALVPVFVTFDMPFTVRPTAIPVWMRRDAPKVPADDVLLTVPFAVSGSTQPMLWQAVDDMHFHLAGAGLKTPNSKGGPVNQGAPGSARRILSDLTLVGDAEPKGTLGQYDSVRRAIRSWRVNEVVVDGDSREPVYAAGFLTAALGEAPTVHDFAWVWKIPSGGDTYPPVTNTSVTLCWIAARFSSAGHTPMRVSTCVLQKTPGHPSS
jgi:dolichyl-phosphate beta-glucosyltransferase